MHVHPLPGLLEPVSALTHLIGALVFAWLAIPMMRRARGDRRRVLLFGIYAGAAVLLLASSGTYHAMPEKSTAREVMGRVDMAAIFLLIAGTHTPVQALFFRGFVRWGVLLAVWMVAALGIVVFTAYYGVLPHGLETGIYLILGWIAGGFGLLVWRRIGIARIAPLLLGGVAFSIGAVMQWQRWPNLAPGVFGAHELWHLAVLAGMGLHWRFLFENCHRDLDCWGRPARCTPRSLRGLGNGPRPVLGSPPHEVASVPGGSRCPPALHRRALRPAAGREPSRLPHPRTARRDDEAHRR